MNDPRPMRERMLAGDLYRGADPESAEISARANRLIERYAQTKLMHGMEAARPILAQIMGSVGEDVYVRAPFWVDFGENIHIGAHTFINNGLTALDVARITIGEHCQIGPNCQLLTPTHPLDPVLRRDGWEAAEPITLGDNVWLGGGVTVCPGVTIGDNTVVGAGSVVTKDLPANVVAVGNPARIIRHLEASA